jgi:molybdate transport system substrate-binding protein
MRLRAVLSSCVLLASGILLTSLEAKAAELKVLTTGAPKPVVAAVADAYAKANGHTVSLVQDTAGGVRKRIEAGEAADVVVATPEVLDALVTLGRIASGSRVDFARTGVGVGVRDGLPKPDIATVEAFKATLLAAPAIALPDPKAGGTSAVYLDGLFTRLGIADMVRAKAKYQAGGYAADIVAKGDAPIVIHQISEITPVKGVTLVGPLPADIQLTSTYSAALAASASANSAAKGLLLALAGAEGRRAAEAAGMDAVK